MKNRENIFSKFPRIFEVKASEHIENREGFPLVHIVVIGSRTYHLMDIELHRCKGLGIVCSIS